MDNHKTHHPVNFRFARHSVETGLRVGEESFPLQVVHHADEVVHLSIGGRWAGTHSHAELTPPGPADGEGEGDARQARLPVGPDGSIRFANAAGATLLDAAMGGSFGVSGRSWLLEFAYDAEMRFYGMGEKLGPLEKSGVRTKFWNRDVFADFAAATIEAGKTDPMYVSIPWLIIRTERGWCGILVNTPEAPFMCAGGSIRDIANQRQLVTEPRLYVGADSGRPEVWFIAAPDLATLTRRYQRLVGTTPLPPLWALGHQQCRWGYGGPEDLREVRDGFARHGIPNSGLWLDIDYMDQFKVFTWQPEAWPDPRAAIAELQSDGQKVVPILDPGVKVAPDFAVYSSGVEAQAFCPTPEGIPFTGFVWPGATVFPDFSTAAGRAWWAQQVKEFNDCGLEGFWLDMNDPSVGPVEMDNLCFGPERLPHAAFHNQYGAAMARATHEALTTAEPDRRPFLLARSGWIGCQRHTALWTGDNLSSAVHMNGSIPCTLNLALSGVPFNGPDVPGFGGDASEALALEWYRLGFLFPFLRNHSMVGTRAQEPHTFSAPVREAIAHLIRLRYKLLPYLYQLWIDQETDGSAVLRPLIHEFDQLTRLPIDRIDDQFMVGPALLQAPHLMGRAEREAVFPACDWFCLSTGRWMRAESRLTLEKANLPVPLFVRAGSVIPMLRGDITHANQVDLSRIDLHVFLRPGEHARVCYRADDGSSLAYRRGERSHVEVDLAVDDSGHLEAKRLSSSSAWQALDIRFVTYGGVRMDAETAPFQWSATGEPLAGLRGT